MIFGWSPGIGDPSLLGWLTVVGYFLAGLLCLRAGGRDAGEKRLWRALGLMLFFLGVNKQLDLQSLFTAVAREFARNGNWYDQRRLMQQLFIAVIAIAGAVATAIVAVRLRNRSRAIQLACGGLALLAAFILIRASSFHHVDRLLKTAVLGARINWVLELGGIAVIAIAATRAGSGMRARVRPMAAPPPGDSPSS